MDIPVASSIPETRKRASKSSDVHAKRCSSGKRCGSKCHRERESMREARVPLSRSVGMLYNISTRVCKNDAPTYYSAWCSFTVLSVSIYMSPRDSAKSVLDPNSISAACGRQERGTHCSSPSSPTQPAPCPLLLVHARCKPPTSWGSMSVARGRIATETYRAAATKLAAAAAVACTGPEGAHRS